ncbi:glucosidase II beta subunit-like protein [Diplocarpon rosae]|nr:glucosidase II beta subunit-like protein [Diplocarpon rosae]
MQPLTLAVWASTFQAIQASQTIFSVHDDLLAFPQYEVVFSDSFISEVEASLIIEQAASAVHKSSPPRSSNTNSVELEKRTDSSQDSSSANYVFDPENETYELMYLNGDQHLCTIPVVDAPVKNDTSETRAAEQKELTRATDRGWELLQDLEGKCLYFVSGWWSYAFCYDDSITQFHQLPVQAGKPQLPPQPDPNTSQFVLGKAKRNDKEDGRDHAIEKSSRERQKTELQIRGDTRYLVQKMEDGTTCDLTGKPRRVEVQFHCNPHVTDRIGYIKEVTTCSYVMVVYTPRLCSDVAFQPPKETKANPMTCRIIVPEEDIADRTELKLLDSAPEKADKEKPINIGGVILGAGKWINKEGQRMPVPANFGEDSMQETVTEIIARAQSKAEGGKVEAVSDEDLRKLDLDPKMIENLKKEVANMAKEKGWKIEVVDAPGQIREILGIVDGDDGDPEDEEDEGSEEVLFKDEL